MTQNVSLTCTAVNNLKISRRRTDAILKIEKSASSHDDAERVHLESLKLNFFNGRCTWEMFCIVVPNFAERHHTLRYIARTSGFMDDVMFADGLPDHAWGSTGPGAESDIYDCLVGLFSCVGGEWLFAGMPTPECSGSVQGGSRSRQNCDGCGAGSGTTCRCCLSDRRHASLSTHQQTSPDQT